MAIFFLSLFGSPSIGMYSLVTERLAIVPQQLVSGARKIRDWLKVNTVETTIGGSVVVGALACGNSNGILLPHFVKHDELKKIKQGSDGINLMVMETKRTAYGNLVLSNDKGAITDPRLNSKTVAAISDTLGVEAVRGEIAGLPYIGSLALATNKGVLAHPLVKDAESRLMEDVLKVPVTPCTINCGIPYVATGLIGNTANVITGVLTTGPEIFIIGQALDVVE